MTPDPEPGLALGPLEIHVWSFSLGDAARGRRLPRAREIRAELLARYLEIDSERLEIIAAPGGKPVLADGSLQFSLSHSEAHAMLAVSRSLPVGIDLDQPRRPSEHRRGVRLEQGIRDRCSAREGAHVLAAADPLDEWTRLWTRKEAVVKATGQGVLDQLAQIDVLDESVVGLDGALTGSWRCLDLEPPWAGFHAAVAFPDVPGVNLVARR